MLVAIIQQDKIIPSTKNCGQNLLEKHLQRSRRQWVGQRCQGGSKEGAWTHPPQPPRYLFLACAIVIHAMLGGHCSGGVQGGGVEGHALYVGDVAGEIGQAQAIRLV